MISLRFAVGPCLLAGLTGLAACNKAKPAEPVASAAIAPAADEAANVAKPAEKALEKPADPVATGPKDAEIAALYAKIAPCDAMDLGKCPEAEALKTLAGERNKDAAKQKPTWDALLDCIDAGNSAQRYACVMAVHFEVYPPNRCDDVATGKRVLKAAQNEQSQYASSRLGEFLACWQESEAAAGLHGELVAFLQDQAMPVQARMELLRLGNNAMKRDAFVDVVYGLMTDAKSTAELRQQVLGIAYRLDVAKQPRFESWLLGKVGDADARFARTVAETLGSVGGPQSLTAVLATWKTQAAGAEKANWASSVARSMQHFLERKDAAIDRKLAYETALAIGKDQSVAGFYRGYAVYALQRSGEARAHKDLEALAKDKDADFAKKAQDAVVALDRK